MVVKVIAEIGINHNGSVNAACEMIGVAAKYGVDYVKFQKRDPDVCVPEEMKGSPKTWQGKEMTYLDYKRRLEFSGIDYRHIDACCDEAGIEWFASVWDIPSAVFCKGMGRSIVKIPSAKITDYALLEYCRGHFPVRLMSTAMSTEAEIVKAIEVLEPRVVFHCCGAYPAPYDALNLRYIEHLKDMAPEVGYSGHEYGLVTTFAAVGVGATWVERHFTLDRWMEGSDHQASVEPVGIEKLVRGVRDIEVALGSDAERVVLECEEEKRRSLRGE